MDLYEIKKNIIKCKTNKQVYDFLNKNNIKYTENEKSWNFENEPKTKRLDINLNEFIHIYWSKYHNGYILQKLVKYEYIPNGKKRNVPKCYGHFETIDDYDTIMITNTQKEF